jgi:hypothetical protein
VPSFFAGFFLECRYLVPTLSTDFALGFSAEITLALIYFLHKEDRVDKKSKSVRMCTPCTMACSSWLMCMGDRSSKRLIFEAGFVVVQWARF